MSKLEGLMEGSWITSCNADGMPEDDEAALTHEAAHHLAQSSDIVDMSGEATTLSCDTVYRGAVFQVDDERIAMPAVNGESVTVRRQVMRHAPCVVMLVHDVAEDRYLLEREYRAGSDLFAFGLPAGLMDEGETVVEAALRELHEETGIVPDTRHSCRIDYIGGFYSSEGMCDEFAHIMVLHLDAWHEAERHFDADEHVQSAWVPWTTLTHTRITSSNSWLAVQHEALRRLKKAKIIDDASMNLTLTTRVH